MWEQRSAYCGEQTEGGRACGRIWSWLAPPHRWSAPALPGGTASRASGWAPWARNDPKNKHTTSILRPSKIKQGCSTGMHQWLKQVLTPSAATNYFHRIPLKGFNLCITLLSEHVLNFLLAIPFEQTHFQSYYYSFMCTMSKLLQTFMGSVLITLAITKKWI